MRIRRLFTGAVGRFPRLAFLSGLLALLLMSCGSGSGGRVCTDLFAYGLNVTVFDAANNQPICDATVTATDGAYSEQLQAGPGFICSYVGAGERPGTYQVTAAKSGFQNASQSGIVVTSDGCHVEGVPVTLRLNH